MQGYISNNKNITTIYKYYKQKLIKGHSFFSTPVPIRHLWQLKVVAFLHWCFTRAFDVFLASDVTI
jgi:hypothetical protein